MTSTKQKLSENIINESTMGTFLLKLKQKGRDPT